jgi:hypothetical protein
MAVILMEFELHLPNCLSAFVLKLIEPLENALASIALTKQEFRHEYCYSGWSIDAWSRIVKGTRSSFHTVSRPQAQEVRHWGKTLPAETNILWRVKNRGEDAFLGQIGSLGYVLAKVADYLLAVDPLQNVPNRKITAIARDVNALDENDPRRSKAFRRRQRAKKKSNR